MAVKSLTTLLTGVVDYAGLFPPAAHSMGTAVRNYADYLKSEDAWMLGRLILPLSRLQEFEQEAQTFLPQDTSPWHLSVLGGLNSQEDVESILEFNGRNLGATIDTVEIALTRVEEILVAPTVYPEAIRVFVEIPIDKDPAPLVQAIADVGLQAKVRTGGITADAFPAREALARFICECANARVQFKATAGLHHPIRAVYNLTYKPDCERGAMYGFLNVFLAAAFCAHGMGLAEVGQVLIEESITAFQFDDSGVSWGSHRLDTDALKRARANHVASFGSCSFREPVEGLQSMGLL